ncbi:MAG: hypothetical protein ABGZ24_01975, partial [Fuerstiella sp.]
NIAPEMMENTGHLRIGDTGRQHLVRQYSEADCRCDRPSDERAPKSGDRKRRGRFATTDMAGRWAAKHLSSSWIT